MLGEKFWPGLLAVSGIALIGTRDGTVLEAHPGETVSRPPGEEHWHGAASDRFMHHSDRGSQYVSIRYTERLAEVGASASVGSVADSYDNAMAEALNGTFKAELIDHQGP